MKENRHYTLPIDIVEAYTTGQMSRSAAIEQAIMTCTDNDIANAFVSRYSQVPHRAEKTKISVSFYPQVTEKLAQLTAAAQLPVEETLKLVLGAKMQK